MKALKVESFKPRTVSEMVRGEAQHTKAIRTPTSEDKKSHGSDGF